jgi:hypothetical protein
MKWRLNLSNMIVGLAIICGWSSFVANVFTGRGWASIAACSFSSLVVGIALGLKFPVLYGKER